MSFQGRCPYKEGTGARDGEAVKKIDSHHFLGLCIICRGCCCHNTATAALACANVKANDVFYTANATNVLFFWALLDRSRQLRFGFFLVYRMDVFGNLRKHGV